MKPEKILYRAKGNDAEDCDKWYKGYYLYTQDVLYEKREELEKAKRTGHNPCHHYILFDKKDKWGAPPIKLKADIRPETLCAYTGFKAKKGKIYQWDIIRTYLKNSDNGKKEEVTCVVCWSPEHGMSVVDTNGGYDIKCPVAELIGSYNWIPGESKIIGNIFDNIELLSEEIRREVYREINGT